MPPPERVANCTSTMQAGDRSVNIVYMWVRKDAQRIPLKGVKVAQSMAMVNRNTEIAILEKSKD